MPRFTFTKNQKESVALSSVLASGALTLLKFIVGLSTGSMGILAEAAHSLLDLGAATLTFFAVRIGDKPADESHPYGHGKVESVSALIETGLLFLTSAWIIYEAVGRLISKTAVVEIAWYSFAVMIISILVDYSRSKALMKVAKKTQSQALEADALHFSSDILSSLVVIAGLLFVKLGLPGADALAAIGVSIFVLRVGYTLGKRTIDVLIDTAPSGISETIIGMVKKVDGVLGVAKIRVRPVGPSLFVDMTVDVSRKISLEAANNVILNINTHLKKSFPQIESTIHTKPKALNSETIAEQVKIIATNHELFVHDVVVQEIGSRRFVSFDVEVKREVTVGEAHKIITRLEEEIKREIDPEMTIQTHIEPLLPEKVIGKEAGQEEITQMQKIITKALEKIPLFQEVKLLKIQKNDGRYIVTLTAFCSAKTSLIEAHETAAKLEFLIRGEDQEIGKVIIHVEPIGRR